VVPASRVEASGWERGSVVVSVALKKDVSGGKYSNRCGIETHENIYISKVGVGKKERK
jgi:hypothetical protein